MVCDYKKISIILFILPALLIFTCNNSFSARAKTKLVFSAIAGSLYVPISMQVLKEAYQQMGFEIEVIEYPAQRSLSMSNQGLIVDGELHRRASAAEKYHNLIMIPVPIGVAQEVAVTKGLDLKIDGLKSIKFFKVGVIRGLRTTRIVKELEPKALFIADSYEQLLIMLYHKRIDVAIMSRLSVLKYKKVLNFNDITILEPPILKIKFLYHFLHKKNKALVKELTSVLKKMKEKGRIHEIQNQYQLNLLY